MKNAVNILKRFISFYLILPLFVFVLLLANITVLGNSLEKDKEKDVRAGGLLDRTLPPTESLASVVEIPDGALPIIAMDMSKDYSILNNTNVKIDEEELLSRALPQINQNEITVLIVHTHATECYADENESFPTPDAEGRYGYYTSESNTRDENVEKNMIAIGEEFCRALADNGIQSIQCRRLHDKDDYNSSYKNSRESIKEYLGKFPSIKYVIDIHRDSLTTSENVKIKTNADSIEGCAQVMMVAGCEGQGVKYDLWEKNLSLNLKYKKVMDEKYPSLSRPIYLRHSKYNLDLLEGSILLEIGSCGNTLSEALNAARLAAECFAITIKS